MAVSQRFNGKQKHCLIYRKQGATNCSKVRTYKWTKEEIANYLSKYGIQ